MSGRGRFYHPYLGMNGENTTNQRIIKNHLSLLAFIEDSIFAYIDSVRKIQDKQFLDSIENNLYNFIKNREEEYKEDYALFNRRFPGYTKNYINALKYVIYLAEQLLEEVYRVKQQILET